MNKKVRKNIELVRDIFLILSVPVIFSYLYILHQEQLELKESTIQLLQQEKEQLANNQIENVAQRYEALKKFYSEEANILRDTLEMQKELILEFDSIIKKTGPDSKHIVITKEQALEAIRNAQRVESYKKRLALMLQIDSVRNRIIESYRLDVLDYEYIIGKK